MKFLKALISKNINGKKVLFLFVLTNLVYSFMLAFSIPKVMAHSNGMKLLDMMPTGYNFEYVNSLFKLLGENGRELYLFLQIPADMFYPFLFGIGYCLLIAFFLNKINKLDSIFFYLCLVPLLAGMADYIENIGIIFMLNSYPAITNFSVEITNLFTIVKSVATTIYFFALIIVLVLFGIDFVKRKRA
ncbi:MAG: hypothetical protein D8M58_13875 [Calditrichaeota bacterium]|nr:MAG: hypothetical protein DWQ03_15115 [Calditrichota bacterium]MBL1206488.1 hypothetical protein [Calditrichota bacterium]NOG46315.1 hypothetical protein [Calditrichota bacterium]